MVNWAKLNTQLSYMNDGLQFGLDMMKSRQEGKSVGDSLSFAGINLFGNAAATQNASELRAWTGSNLGYVAKNAANGDGQQALENTTQASMQTWQLGMMGRMMMGGGCYCQPSVWDMQMPNYTYTTPMWPGMNNFHSSFFRQGWFG